MGKAGNEELYHNSVLLSEVLKAFQLDAPLKKSVRIIDATLGLGGHTIEMVKSGAQILGIDTDLEMLKVAEKKLSIACPIPEVEQGSLRGFWKLRNGNFKDIDKIAKEEEFDQVDGILMDLGVSSPQITSPKRGLSFQNDHILLDMRLDQVGQSVTGSDLLNALRTDQLIELFENVLTRKDAINLSRLIAESRSIKKISTVGDFKSVINRVIRKVGKLESYTLPFLALRIAVNSELEILRIGLSKSLNLLKSGGRLVVISFHSGEDRIVKHSFVNAEKSGFEIVNGLILPTKEEIRNNPRSRSAKMRILEKI